MLLFSEIYDLISDKLPSLLFFKILATFSFLLFAFLLCCCCLWRWSLKKNTMEKSRHRKSRSASGVMEGDFSLFLYFPCYLLFFGCLMRFCEVMKI